MESAATHKTEQSDESTRHVIEPRGGSNISTTIPTMLEKEPRLVAPEVAANMVFPVSRGKLRDTSLCLDSGIAAGASTPKVVNGGHSEAEIIDTSAVVDKRTKRSIRGRTMSPGDDHRVHSTCRSTSPLVKIIPKIEVEQVEDTEVSPSSNSRKGKGIMSKRARAKESFVLIEMDYNEYGELVDKRTLNQPKKTEELNVTELLRVIKKGFHHDLRDKLGKIIVPQGDGKDSVLVESFVSKDRLTSWDFKSQQRKTPTEPTTEGSPLNAHNVPVYDGPPHVLEIGCSDGAWCLNFKQEMPDWIIEGVDDTDHWACLGNKIEFNDFMKASSSKNLQDYFSRVSFEQKFPEFTVRNINNLLNHEIPMLHNVYEFIRGREIFDRVENFKTFLDDIRLMLKPDGVVEFLEIDPRPRAIVVRREGVSEEHKSCPQTNWTDNIEDRFRDPFDEELATNVPGWTERVAERLKATMRPRDGVPAANLTSWLEGGGFWDVKEIIIPVPVGGNSRPGQRLKEYILYQIGLEDDVPKLREQLPKAEIDVIESGTCHLNIHVITGRKPNRPRPGDLLMDGKRQDMTDSSYDAMARNKAIRVTALKRFEMGSNVDSMVENLKNLPGAPEVMSKESEQDVSALLKRSVEFQNAVIVEEPDPLDAGNSRTNTALMDRRKAGLSEESRAVLSDRTPRAP